MLLVCIVMAGGRGSRMGGAVKPLLRVCGRPLIEHVVEALGPLCSRIVVAVGPYTAGSLAGYCRGVLLECVYTPGLGYPRDLGLALRIVRSRPVLVAPGDALVDSVCLQRVVGEALRVGEPVVTFVKRGEPTGFALFHGDGGDWVDVELPCVHDVDEPRDLVEAERLCGFTVGTRREER